MARYERPCDVSGRIHTTGTKDKSKKYRALRSTKLKECYIVRYADDFKLFCRNYSDAVIMFEATKKWLKERLGLDISPEKSKIVNLKKEYSYFLGFKIKVHKKGKYYHNVQFGTVDNRTWVYVSNYGVLWWQGEEIVNREDGYSAYFEITEENGSPEIFRGYELWYLSDLISADNLTLPIIINIEDVINAYDSSTDNAEFEIE